MLWLFIRQHTEPGGIKQGEQNLVLLDRQHLPSRMCFFVANSPQRRLKCQVIRSMLCGCLRLIDMA